MDSGAGGHPGRQVLAKLRLQSNIRVITRYYTEHVDELAEAGSPTTTSIATTSSSIFFFSFSSSSTYYFLVFAVPLAASLLHAAPRSLSPPPHQLIPRSHFYVCSLALGSRSNAESRDPSTTGIIIATTFATGCTSLFSACGFCAQIDSA